MEKRLLLKQSAPWTIAGAFFFLLVPVRGLIHQSTFKVSEPFFAAPIQVDSDRTMILRMDTYGKGYFGASRNGGRIHNGVDLAVPVGEKILASKSGRVIFAGVNRGYGHSIDILHPEGVWTRYAHLSELHVDEGDWVWKNETIGLSGKSGNAGNSKMVSHVHFEIRDGQEALNPTKGLLDPSVTVVRP